MSNERGMGASFVLRRWSFRAAVACKRFMGRSCIFWRRVKALVEKAALNIGLNWSSACWAGREAGAKIGDWSR